MKLLVSHFYLGMKMYDLAILIGGYIVVNSLSLIIAARVRKHLTAFYALFTHIFVILIALYYCIDVLLLQRPIFYDAYFYLWIAIIITQMIIILLGRKKHNRNKTNSDQRKADSGKPTAESEQPTANREQRIIP